MRTERIIFFRPVLFVSPLCAGPMRKISLATSEKREWKSGVSSTQRYPQLFSLYVDICVIKNLTVIPKCDLLCSNCKRLIAFK